MFSLRFPLVLALALICLPLLAGSPAEPERGCSLEVHVTSSEGNDLDAAKLLLTREGQADLRPELKSDGAYIFRVVPGTYTLSVTREGFAPASQSVTLLAGHHDAIKVALGLDAVFEYISVTERRRDATVFKFPTTLHETPRSVTLVDEAQIRDHNYRSVNDTLAYAPGFAVNSNRTGGYHFYARGYRMGPDDTRIDGFSGVNSGGRYSASLFGIDQVLLLRGPAGLLYGASGAPGGMVNMITKKPSETASTRVDLRSATYQGNGVGFGDRNTGAMEVDSTGALDAGGRVLYRALGLVENAAYYSKGVDDENRALNLALTFNLDSERRYRLTPSYQWTHFDRPYGGGLVFSPSTSLTTNDGLEGPINRDDLTSLNVNPSSGGGIDETKQIGLLFQADLSSSLRLNASYRNIVYDTEIDQYTPTISSASQRALFLEGLVLRTHAISNSERRSDNADVNATYEIESNSSWRSLFQLGVNTRLYTARSTSPSGAVPGPQSPVNIHTGEVLEPLDASYPSLNWNDWSDTSSWNGYLQNQTSFADGRWVTTLGLGYGQVHPEGLTTHESNIMPNAALIYNPNQRLAVYASYATSFNPTDPEAQDAQGNLNSFGPEKGENMEVGLKYDQPGGRASLQFSVFQNELNDDLVQSASTDLNPNGQRYYVQAGTREAQGAELSYTGLLKDLQVAASLSYLDATYTGEGPAGAPNLPLPGTRAEKAPEWSSSLFTTYTFSRGVLTGLNAQLGWIWSDERLGSNRGRTETEPDPLMLPAYSRFDLGFNYGLTSGVDFQIQVQNLLDELIFVNGSTGANLEVAAPRTLNLRVGYRF